MSPGRRVAAVTALGFVLRAAFLDRQPLWRDEAFTAIVVQRPAGEMLSAVSRDSAPPLHYLLEHAVVSATPATPLFLRLISLLAGTALIPLVALLARRAAGDRAGLAAALIAALLPATVIASRDARMYALAATLSCAALLLLWRALERPSALRVLAYAAAVAAALWTDYFTAFAVCAGLAASVVVLRPPWRRLTALVVATAAAALTLIPWLIAARAQFEHGAIPFWVEPVGLKTVSGTAVQFFSGPPIDPGVPWKIPLQVLQGLSVAAGGLALLVLILRRRSLDPDARRGTAFLALAGGIGIALLVAVSIWHPLLEARYASVLWTPLVAATGIGLTLVPGRRWQAALVAAAGVPALVLSAAITHPQTAAVIPSGAALGAHDIVAADPSEFLLVEYYGDDTARARTHVIATDVPWFWGTAAYPAGAVLPAVPPDVSANGGHIIWISDPEYPPPSLPQGYAASAQTCAIRVCAVTFSRTG